MKCKYCGLAIHKCSSANEYHADDRAEYMKELNGSGCIHQPATPPNKACSGRAKTWRKIEIFERQALPRLPCHCPHAALKELFL